MSKPDLLTLFTREEYLCPELASWLEEHEGLGVVLKHPLVFQVPYMGQMNAWLNEHYRVKSARVAADERDGNWPSVLVLHERPYRMMKLLEIGDLLGDKEYGELLGWVWRDTENLWQNADIISKLLAPKRGVGFRKYLMSKEEKSFLVGLPKIIDVYRGCSDRNRKGFSWTLDVDKAVWFSKRFSKEPVLLHGKVEKRNVVAYFAGRGESEIVVNPDFVKIHE